MNWKLLIAALALEACVPSAKKSPDVKAPSLSITGNLLFADSHGRTEIYIEDAVAPFATTNDANFSLELSNEQMESLRHAQGGSNGPLRLYFVSEDARQTAVNSTLRFTDRGAVNIGTVSMLPEIRLSGTVDAINPVDGQPMLVADALVQVGRYKTRTNASGEFQIRAAQNADLPLTIECEEFVRSVGTWQTQSADTVRNLRLYKNLEPIGQVEMIAGPRSAGANVDLLISGNAMSRYIRISANAEDLNGEASAAAPWMSLDEGLKLPSDYLELPIVYYQFADESRTALGPVLSFTPPPSVE